MAGQQWMEMGMGQARQKDGILAGFGGKRNFLLKRGQASKLTRKLVAIPDGWIKQSIMLDTRNCN
jgi:hypothetical protein